MSQRDGRHFGKGGWPVLLFFDGHASRWTHSGLLELINNWIFPFCLAGHTSIWSQPNDGGANESFGRILGDGDVGLRKWRNSNRSMPGLQNLAKLTRRDFNAVFVAVYMKFVRIEKESLATLGSNSITAGWVGTGLEPYQRNPPFWRAAISSFGKREELAVVGSSSSSREEGSGSSTAAGGSGSSREEGSGSSTAAGGSDGSGGCSSSGGSGGSGKAAGVSNDALCFVRRVRSLPVGASLRLLPAVRAENGTTAAGADACATLLMRPKAEACVMFDDGRPQELVADADIAALHARFRLPAAAVKGLDYGIARAVRRRKARTGRKDAKDKREEQAQLGAQSWKAAQEALREELKLSPADWARIVLLLSNAPPVVIGDALVSNSVLIGEARVIHAAVAAAVCAPFAESVAAAKGKGAAASSTRKRAKGAPDTYSGLDVLEALDEIEELGLRPAKQARAKEEAAAARKRTQTDTLASKASPILRELLQKGGAFGQLAMQKQAALVRYMRTKALDVDFTKRPKVSATPASSDGDSLAAEWLFARQKAGSSRTCASSWETSRHRRMLTATRRPRCCASCWRRERASPSRTSTLASRRSCCSGWARRSGR